MATGDNSMRASSMFNTLCTIVVLFVCGAGVFVNEELLSRIGCGVVATLALVHLGLKALRTNKGEKSKRDR